MALGNKKFPKVMDEDHFELIHETLERITEAMSDCLERRADLHTAQLMPLPPTDSCFSKIRIGFTFLVPDHPGSPGQRAVKRACVCICRGQVF